jgi:hypothetical protein
MSLRFLYKGFYFSKLADTYTDYGAWSESCSGAGGLPSDESIELFLDLLTASGIHLTDMTQRVPQVNLLHLYDKYSVRYAALLARKPDYEDFDGFIFTGFEGADEVDQILSQVQKGKSLVFVNFNARFAIYSPVTQHTDHFFQAVELGKEVLGEELHVQRLGFGKVLFVDGSRISDYALDTWKDQKATEKEYPSSFVDRILAELKDFRIPYLTASVLSSPPKAWLTNEVLLLSVRVSNVGVAAQSVTISLKIGNNIEPLSATDLYFSTVGHAETKDVNFMIQCLKPGEYERYLSLEISCQLGKHSFARRLPVHCETNFISPTAAVRGTEPSADKQTLLDRYRNLPGRLGELSGFQNLFDLMDLDPSSTILKSRTLLERVVNKLFKDKLGPAHDLNLEGKLRGLWSKGLLDNKTYGWMNTVRILGNIMAHPGDEAIQANRDDALVVVNILLNVIDELLAKGLI